MYHNRLWDPRVTCAKISSSTSPMTTNRPSAVPATVSTTLAAARPAGCVNHDRYVDPCHTALFRRPTRDCRDSLKSLHIQVATRVKDRTWLCFVCTSCMYFSTK